MRLVEEKHCFTNITTNNTIVSAGIKSLSADLLTTNANTNQRAPIHDCLCMRCESCTALSEDITDLTLVSTIVTAQLNQERSPSAPY